MEKFAGIPYDEQAMMLALSDIEEFKAEREKREAMEIFHDLAGFFSEPMKTRYLLVLLSKGRVLEILDSVEKSLSRLEEYEKCSQVARWKKRVHEI